MESTYINILNNSSQEMHCVPDQSVDLIVTSPPYPMIEMWDECFCAQNQAVHAAISLSDWNTAYKEMHHTLNQVWNECDRVLKENGFICINIGDATRTCNGEFRLFTNHSAIIQHFENMGYSTLPDIHWRKQTNAPNKFMGSGMLPAGAYVTYEHEYILIFRKGGKRKFDTSENKLRSQSAYFWEERNIWFSDLWEIKGTSQFMKNINSRVRSAAYPFEIPYRLINMYSIYGDTVLDPFGGIGTTAVACAATGRSCIISEIDPDLVNLISQNIENAKNATAGISANRIRTHMNFINNLSSEKLEKCYINFPHGFPVKTRQETQLVLVDISRVAKMSNHLYKIHYEPAEYQLQISIDKSPDALIL